MNKTRCDGSVDFQLSQKYPINLLEVPAIFTQSLIFRGSNVVGPLTVDQFHGQVWPVSRHVLTSETDKRSGVDSMC